MGHLTDAKAVTFIITNDRAKATAFYGETLGLTPGQNDHFASVFDLAGTTLRITEVPGFIPSAHSVLGWHVTDIVATAQDLVAKGIEMTIYEGFGQDSLGIWTSPDGKGKVAWFKDPDGNVLSLTEG